MEDAAPAHKLSNWLIFAISVVAGLPGPHRAWRSTIGRGLWEPLTSVAVIMQCWYAPQDTLRAQLMVRVPPLPAEERLDLSKLMASRRDVVTVPTVIEPEVLDVGEVTFSLSELEAGDEEVGNPDAGGPDDGRALSNPVASNPVLAGSAVHDAEIDGQEIGQDVVVNETDETTIQGHHEPLDQVTDTTEDGQVNTGRVSDPWALDWDDDEHRVTVTPKSINPARPTMATITNIFGAASDEADDDPFGPPPEVFSTRVEDDDPFGPPPVRYQEPLPPPEDDPFS